MKVGVIGRQTRDKTFLMLYLGKVLSQGLKVKVITGDQWFIPGLATYEYTENLVIEQTMTASDPEDLVIMDMTQPDPTQEVMPIFVTGIDRVSVEENHHIFASWERTEKDTFLVHSLLMDSKINEKYLCNRLGIDRKRDALHILYFDDNDMAVHIENEYNDRLDIKGLSKSYKRLLFTMGGLCGVKDQRQLKRWLKAAERSR